MVHLAASWVCFAGADVRRSRRPSLNSAGGTSMFRMRGAARERAQGLFGGAAHFVIARPIPLFNGKVGVWPAAPAKRELGGHRRLSDPVVVRVELALSPLAASRCEILSTAGARQSVPSSCRRKEHFDWVWWHASPDYAVLRQRCRVFRNIRSNYSIARPFIVANQQASTKEVFRRVICERCCAPNVAQHMGRREQCWPASTVGTRTLSICSGPYTQ